MQDTSFTVWATVPRCLSLKPYSTDAPIEQVLFHWEKWHLLPSLRISIIRNSLRAFEYYANRL